MDGVRKVADTGRTIVFTIHQPSTLIFQLFDSLLLLKRGGEMVFFGELGNKSAKLVEYCEKIDGVPELEENYNPATRMLEVIGAGVDNNNTSKTDFVSLFKDSELYRQLHENLNREGVAQPSSELPPLTFEHKRAASNLTQARFLVERFFDYYWRTPSYNLTRCVIAILLGLVFGITFLGAEYKTYQGINSALGMIYRTTSYMTFLTFGSVLPITCHERAAYYRERGAQTYNAFWYFVGATLVEIPYCFVYSLLFLAVFFPVVGFTGVSEFFIYWLQLSVIVLLEAYFGQFLIYLLPSLEVASVVFVIINFLILFNGFNPPASSIPHGYKWLYDITPTR